MDDIGELVGHGAGEGDGGVGGCLVDTDVVGVSELRVVVLDDDSAGDEGACGDLFEVREAGAGVGDGVYAAFGADNLDLVDIGFFDDDAGGIAVRGTRVRVPYQGCGIFNFQSIHLLREHVENDEMLRDLAGGNVVEVFDLRVAEVLAVGLVVDNGAVVVAVEDFADGADGAGEGEGLAGDARGEEDDAEEEDVLLPGGDEDAELRGAEGDVLARGDRGEEAHPGAVEEVDEDVARVGEEEGCVDPPGSRPPRPPLAGGGW